MKQIYYTQEGTPYYLVTVTRTTDQTTALSTQINPRLVVNPIPTVDNNSSLDAIYVKTDKPIVPLIMNYSLQNVSGGGPVVPPQVNMSTPYYNVILGGVAKTNHLPCLSKVLPNIENLSPPSPQPNQNFLQYSQQEFNAATVMALITAEQAFFSAHPSYVLVNRTMLFNGTDYDSVLTFTTNGFNSLYNRYGVKYNQVVLTDKDFVTSNINNTFQFKPELFDVYPSGIGNITQVGASRWIVVQTVIYFELQK